MSNTPDVTVVEREESPIISVRDTINMQQLDKLFGQVYGKIGQLQPRETGALFAIYYDQEFDPTAADTEVGCFVGEPIAGETGTMKGGTHARILHKGAYNKLPSSYAYMPGWIEQHGYQMAGPPYEVYLNDPSDTPTDELLTEVYFPLKKE